MKCIAYKKQFNKATEKLRLQTIRQVVSFMTASTAEIMLSKFHWSQDRLIELLRRVWAQFDLTGTPLLDLNDFDPEDNFGYSYKLRNSLVRIEGVSPYSRASDDYAQQAMVWFLNIIVYSLKDDFGWADSTTDKFIRYLDAYLPLYQQGPAETYRITERLKEEHNVELRMHLTA